MTSALLAAGRVVAGNYNHHKKQVAEELDKAEKASEVDFDTTAVFGKAESLECWFEKTVVRLQ